MLDNYYITVFNHYKRTLGRRSFTLAMFYINLLELSILLVLGAFFMAFANQMKLVVMSSSKFWLVFVLISCFAVFKNWMRYNGKKRNVLNAKLKAKPTSIYLLWLLPFGCLTLAFVLFQVI